MACIKTLQVWQHGQSKAEQQHTLSGVGQTPANEHDHSAYHSELFGLWGMYSLHQFTKKHNIAEGKVTIACNGLLALHKAQGQQMTELNEVHYELITAIQTLQYLLPIQVIYEHVKGNQDNGQVTALP